MNTKRISDSIEKILNKQVRQEAEAAQIFLSYAIWAEDKGYSGTLQTYYSVILKERDHMMKVIQYIQQEVEKLKYPN